MQLSNIYNTLYCDYILHEGESIKVEFTYCTSRRQVRYVNSTFIDCPSATLKHTMHCQVCYK